MNDPNCSQNNSFGFNTSQASLCITSVPVPMEVYPMYSIVFQCLEGAVQLSSCQYYFANSCRSGEEAGVICLVPCEYGGMRLVGGSTDLEGNVEICVNGVWGTICDPSWGATEAKVICTSLGYSEQGKDSKCIGCIIVLL